MTTRRQQTGRTGEDLAARFLEREGCRVVARNYRCPVGELDLVVDGPEGLVIVEVRTRQLPCLVRPEETITRSKAMHLVRAAQWYLASTGQEDRPWRVDLVAVELSSGGEPLRMQRFRDATSGIADHGG